MSKFRLAFGIHNHQPVGNFAAVFEAAHTMAYLPFLKLVESCENIAISLHQSGILWHWQEKAHPEYFELVGRLVDRGRLELLTGGFYEPILSSIPERDIFGQIRMLTTYIAEHFEVTPEGFWLTERIWEPHLPKVLAQSGVKYLPIDDTHFLYAGLELAQLTGPFVTESEGYTLTLLPIQKKLRYLIPFGTVEEVFDELKQQAEKDPAGMAIYADDGEKFGVWPNTHSHCYEDHWLEELLEGFQQNSDWLEVIPLGKAAAKKPSGRVYLPTASYAEMLHWALPSRAFLEYESFERWLKDEGMLERYGRFVRGGHWRGFLSKYEESNLMHKKMLAVSDKLDMFEREHPDQRNRTLPVRERLYAGQCNCPYWHGVFGGLYLPHIRQAVYGNLIEADAALNNMANLTGIHLTERDFDADGQPEVVVTGQALSAVLKPSRGGMLVDLSLNKHGFSLTDTLTRRREGYHLKLDKAVTKAAAGKTASIHDVVLAKEEGLKDFLVEDWYLKRCFIDHFLTDDVDLERFRAGQFGDEGDFVLEPFTHRLDESARSVTLTREGHLWRVGGPVPVKVVKIFRFSESSEMFVVHYEISSPHVGDLWVSFAVESNFNFQAGHAEDRFIRIDGERRRSSYLDSVAEHHQASSYALVDQYRDLAVAVVSEKESTIWHLPIFTVSLSEAGFEKVYQGTTLVNLFRVNLGYEPFTLDLTLYTGTVRQVTESVTSRAKVNSA